MKQKRPELILSLRQVTGEARKILSTHVQEQLFKLGYSWGSGKIITRADRENLHIFSPEWRRLDITYSDGPPQTTGSASFFDASQVTEFLTRAEEFSTIKTNIHGVDITIRGDSVDLDPSKLLVDVSTHAKQLQHENFGS